MEPLYIPLPQSLNQSNCYEHVSRLFSQKRIYHPEVHIDLSSLISYDPYALLTLMNMPRIIRDNYKDAKLKVSVPRRYNESKDQLFCSTIKDVLFRFDVFDAKFVGKKLNFRNDCTNINLLIPITRINRPEDTAKIMECYSSDAFQNSKLQEYYKKLLIMISSELSENIATHSNSSGFIVTRYYENQKGFPGGIIRINASDAGIGVRNALNRNPGISINNDGDALVQSLEAHMTGTCSRRGIGLNGIVRQIKKLRASMYMRTGDYLFQLSCRSCNSIDCRDKMHIDPSNCGLYQPTKSIQYYGTQIELLIYL